MATNNQESIDRKTHQRRVRKWIIWCIAFLLFAPVMSIMIGLNLHARDFQYKGSDVNTFRTLLFEVVLISADPQTRSMVIDWSIIGEENSDCSNTNLQACSAVNIFFDNNLLQSSEPGELQSSDRPTKPIFRFNSTNFVLRDILGNTPTFRTALSLFSPGDKRSNLLYYPFDTYSAEILVFAQDFITNNTVGIKLAKTRGIAVGFKMRAFDRPDVFIPPGMVDIMVHLSRENLVRAYSIIATTAIWLITLVLLLVMLTTVFFGFQQKGEVLLIPVATVFAFTQLRQSMPGAPEGFGDIVDFVGLLPCLALLSLSAVLTLGAFLFTDPTDTPQKLSWSLLFEAFPSLKRHRDLSG